MKVLICDDEQERSDEVVASIKDTGIADIEIEQLTGNKLKEQLDSLFERVKVSLGEESGASPGLPLSFDQADVAIIDNNLAHLHINGARLTGESIIGHVRCFSAVPYIVSLNKNPDVDFDLRFLVGDYETRADVALNVEHLSIPGLWDRTRHSPSTFLPWYWPELLKAPRRRRDQITFIKSHFEESVLGSLGFPDKDEHLAYLSLHARSALSSEADFANNATIASGKPLADITFSDMFRDRNRSLAAKNEREYLLEASTTDATVIELLARVVAADVEFWFRRDVLGPQDMLVDVPHLLMRMPFLLANPEALDVWNEAVLADKPPYGLDSVLYRDHLTVAEFANPIWTGRPAYWWPKLKEDAQLTERFFSANTTQWADVVFCEDISAFQSRPMETEAYSGPLEFAAEFEGSWVRRQVAKLPDVGYKPLSRFAV